MQSWQIIYIGLLISGTAVGVILTGLSVFLIWVKYMDKRKQKEDAMTVIHLPPSGNTTKSAS